MYALKRKRSDSRSGNDRRRTISLKRFLYKGRKDAQKPENEGIPAGILPGCLALNPAKASTMLFAGILAESSDSFRSFALFRFSL